MNWDTLNEGLTSISWGSEAFGVVGSGKAFGVIGSGKAFGVVGSGLDNTFGFVFLGSCETSGVVGSSEGSSVVGGSLNLVHGLGKSNGNWARLVSDKVLKSSSGHVVIKQSTEVVSI
jgi:hypothetical protein